MEKQTINIWSSGGGVQSNAIAALIVSGILPKPDLSVIIDTTREQETTWEYMNKYTIPALNSVDIKLHRINKNDYTNIDLYGGKNKNTLELGAYTDLNGKGKLRGYCSNEWKRNIMRRYASSVYPKAKFIVWQGISIDEPKRIRTDKSKKWTNYYPLVNLKISRKDCFKIIKEAGWKTPPRSSCWCCPNHTQEEWRLIKNTPDWEKAVKLDKEIREKGKDNHYFLHPSCKPLNETDLSEKEGVLFNHGCSSGNCFI